MMQRRVILDVQTFSPEVRALCMEGMLTKAKCIIDGMSQGGVEPDVVTSTY